MKFAWFLVALTILMGGCGWSGRAERLEGGARRDPPERAVEALHDPELKSRIGTFVKAARPRPLAGEGNVVRMAMASFEPVPNDKKDFLLMLVKLGDNGTETRFAIIVVGGLGAPGIPVPARDGGPFDLPYQVSLSPSMQEGALRLDQGFAYAGVYTVPNTALGNRDPIMVDPPTRRFLWPWKLLFTRGFSTGAEATEYCVLALPKKGEPSDLIQRIYAAADTARCQALPPSDEAEVPSGPGTPGSLGSAFPVGDGKPPVGSPAPPKAAEWRQVRFVNPAADTKTTLSTLNDQESGDVVFVKAAQDFYIAAIKAVWP